MKKAFIFIFIMMFIVSIGYSYQVKKIPVKKSVKKIPVKPGIVHLNADLRIPYMSVWGCKCKCAEKYGMFEVGEVTVEVANKGIKTNAKVILAYFDMKLNKMVTKVKYETIDKFKYVTFKLGPVMVKQSKGIEATVKSTKNIKDPNPSNNTYIAKKCQHKQPR